MSLMVSKNIFNEKVLYFCVSVTVREPRGKYLVNMGNINLCANAPRYYIIGIMFPKKRTYKISQ